MSRFRVATTSKTLELANSTTHLQLMGLHAPIPRERSTQNKVAYSLIPVVTHFCEGYRLCARGGGGD